MPKIAFRCDKCKKAQQEHLYSYTENFNGTNIWLCLKCYNKKYETWKDYETKERNQPGDIESRLPLGQKVFKLIKLENSAQRLRGVPSAAYVRRKSGDFKSTSDCI